MKNNGLILIIRKSFGIFLFIYNYNRFITR